MKEHTEQVPKQTVKSAITVKVSNSKDKNVVLNQYGLLVLQGNCRSYYLNKQKRFDNRESPEKLCIKNLFYHGSTTQQKFSLIEFYHYPSFALKTNFYQNDYSNHKFSKYLC